MAGFADLVRRAQPALVAGGVLAAATEGRDWEWRFTGMVDDAGDPIDLTNVTITCALSSGVNGTTLVTLSVTGTDEGTFTVSASHTQTQGLVTGAGPRSCCWSCWMSAGGDEVQVWLPDNSPFSVRSN